MHTALKAVLPPRAAPSLRLLAAEPDLELPLGWSWNDSPRAREELSVLALPSGAKFVYAARLSPSTSLAQLRQKLRALGEHVVVRSCSEGFLEQLGGGTGLTFSSSARLDLQGYRPPHKVRNLARRGAKAVVVRELSIDDPAGEAVDRWLAGLRGDGPGLKYLFRTELSGAQRAFAAFAPNAQLAGLVTLTRFGDSAWHVELLSRDPHAPQGTMEHLLASVIQALQHEGAQSLNLGEIALDFCGRGSPLSWLNRLVIFLAPLLIRLVRGRYDVAGLHRFKNKFEPAWEPRFVYGTPRLRWRDLEAISRKSGLQQLL